MDSTSLLGPCCQDFWQVLKFVTYFLEIQFFFKFNSRPIGGPQSPAFVALATLATAL